MLDESFIQANTAAVIRNWRKVRGMSQSALAEKLGVHQTTIAKLENNERRIDFATVVQIAQILDIPWLEFLQEPKSELEQIIEAVDSLVSLWDTWIMTLQRQVGDMRNHASSMSGLLTRIEGFEIPEDLEEPLQALVLRAAQLHRSFVDLMPSLDAFDSAKEKLNEVRDLRTEIGRRINSGPAS